jgi:hypothetical protein
MHRDTKNTWPAATAKCVIDHGLHGLGKPRKKKPKKALSDEVWKPYRPGKETVVAGRVLAAAWIHSEEHARNPAAISAKNPSDNEVGEAPKAGLVEARNELLKDRIEGLGDRLVLHALSLLFVL